MYFNKNITICLLVIVISQASLSDAMERQRFHVESIRATIAPTNDLNISKSSMKFYKLTDSPLWVAVQAGKLDDVEKYSENVDLNKKSGFFNNTILSQAIEKAGYSLVKNRPDSKIRLKIVELLIQKGARINEPICGELTALEDALSPNKPELNIVKILLGYGAHITKKCMERVESKSNKKRIMRILNAHQNLLKQVKSNPTKKLLKLAIKFNKPYMVQLIVETRPELVTAEYIKPAKIKSPFSVQLLQKALNIFQFQEIAQEDLPPELIDRIRKFVLYNK